MTGQVFAEGTVVSGRFRVEKMLGAGGYGEVYAAEQLSMGRKVALKVLRAHLAEREGALDRFRNEAKYACRLRHPNTVVYHDFGDDPDLGVFWLAMEYLEGRSLEQRLRQDGVLSLEECADILDGVAGSLHEAHQLGLIHRDIKPANIMLVDRGGNPNYVKVIDFGIAKSVALETTGDIESLTETGTVLGSPAYMAPEQIRREHAPMGPPTDVYALTVMIYRLLSGVLPFRGSTPIEVAMAHLTADAPRLGSLGNVAAPPAVERLLLEALSKDPADRPQTAETLAKAFRTAIATPVPSATTPTGLLTDEEPTDEGPAPTPTIAARPKWTNRHKTQALLTVTVIFLGFAVIVGLGAVGIKELIKKGEMPDPASAAADVGEADASEPAPQPDAVAVAVNSSDIDAGPAGPSDVAVVMVADAAPDEAVAAPAADPKTKVRRPARADKTRAAAGEKAAPTAKVAAAADKPSQKLKVTINARPWGKITVGGRSAERRLVTQLAPGTYTVTTVMRGPKKHRITVSESRTVFVLNAE